MNRTATSTPLRAASVGLMGLLAGRAEAFAVAPLDLNIGASAPIELGALLWVPLLVLALLLAVALAWTLRKPRESRRVAAPMPVAPRVLKAPALKQRPVAVPATQPVGANSRRQAHGIAHAA